MTFRKRILVATLVIGGGVLAFQPIMRSRIEQRLSDILNAKVTVGQSRISLIQGTIQLTDIQVQSPNNSEPAIHIDQAALKFDWGSAAYRNLRIEQLLASGTQLRVHAPAPNSIPIAKEDSPSKTLDKLLSESNRDRQTGQLQSVMQPIRRAFDEEVSRHALTQESINSKLTAVDNRLKEAMPAGNNVNPLRQRLVVDDVKKELALIRQAVAEDRLRRKEAQKTFAAAKIKTQEGLSQQLDSDTWLVHNNLQEIAISFARSSIAQQWNQYRSVVHTALHSIDALANEDGATSEFRDDASIDIDEMPYHIPGRKCLLVFGKVRGTMEGLEVVPSANGSFQEFELKMRNIDNQTVSDDSIPSITLSVQGTDKQNQMHRVVCNVDRIQRSQSDSHQYQIQLEHRSDANTPFLASIQQSGHGWASSVELGMRKFLEHFESHFPDSEINQLDNQRIKARLIGTTAVSDNSDPQLSIEVDESSIQVLEAVMEKACAEIMKKRRADFEKRGESFLNQELQTMARRWDEIADDHLRTHSNWEELLVQLNERIGQFESNDRRLTRQNTISTR